MRIINVMAGSIDGCIAAHPEESDAERRAQGFSSEADLAHLRALLGKADAVIVGAHSVNVGGGIVRARNDRGVAPTWILCTNSGRPADAPMWRRPEWPKWVLSRDPLPADRTSGAVRTLTYGDGSLPQTAIAACREAGFERVLLFGGGRINQLFYAEDAVDELVLTLCPVLVGTSTGVPLVAPELPHPVRFALDSVRTEEDLVFVHYRVRSG